jgi:ABC-type spermidine/putrescine transport system permease subunit II
VGLPFTGWTLDWYSQVFGDYQIKDALTTSIKVALEVS